MGGGFFFDTLPTKSRYYFNTEITEKSTELHREIVWVIGNEKLGIFRAIKKESGQGHSIRVIAREMDNIRLFCNGLRNSLDFSAIPCKIVGSQVVKELKREKAVKGIEVIEGLRFLKGLDL